MSVRESEKTTYLVTFSFRRRCLWVIYDKKAQVGRQWGLFFANLAFENTQMRTYCWAEVVPSL